MSSDHSAVMPGDPDAGAVVPYHPASPAPRNAPPAVNIVVRSNWAPVTEADKIRAMRAMNGDCRKAGDVIGEELHLTHYLAHPVILTDQATGELLQKERVVLVTANAGNVACVSDGVVSSLRMLCSLWGEGPWAPAVKVKIVQQTTAKGRRVFKLDVLGRAEAPAQQEESKRGGTRRIG